MKNLSKAILTVITHFIGFFCLFILLNNLNTWIVSVFPDYGDWEDWWYEFTEYRHFHYIAATAIFSGCTYYIWHLAVKHVNAKGALIPVLLIGEGLLVLVNHCYWFFLSHICFGHGSVTLDACFNMAFGSCEAAKSYFSVAMYAFFAIGILQYGSSCMVSDPVNKVVLHQISSGDAFCLDMLCTYVPVCNMITGSYYWGMNAFPIIRIISMVLGVAAAIHLLLRVVKQQRIVKYYQEAMAEDDIHKTIVIVREIGSFEESMVYQLFLKNRSVTQKFTQEHIYILPVELQSVSKDPCIVIDIFASQILELPEDQQSEVVTASLQERGLFNIAFSDGAEGSIPASTSYDECTADIASVFRAITIYSGYLEYRKKQNAILSKIHLEGFTQTNVILDEIIGFKRHLACTFNQFLVFDYAIKWMETFNYFCSLISISLQRTGVSTKALSRINYADFLKWSEFRKKGSKSEKVDSFLSKTFSKEDPVHMAFCFVWKEVTSKTYSFSKYTINEFLHALRELRNYTRGHGVFTFEISQEINLALVEILVFLINQLIESKLLEENFDNLEELGWLVLVGDTPYFLYSYDSKYQECRFDSFQNGNSITLPADIRRIRK